MVKPISRGWNSLSCPTGRYGVGAKLFACCLACSFVKITSRSSACEKAASYRMPYCRIPAMHALASSRPLWAKNVAASCTAKYSRLLYSQSRQSWREGDLRVQAKVVVRRQDRGQSSHSERSMQRLGGNLLNDRLGKRSIFCADAKVPNGVVKNDPHDMVVGVDRATRDSRDKVPRRRPDGWYANFAQVLVSPA